MRLIDADALGELVNHGLVHYEDIMAQPTVDAVEVIRCKDCIWNREKEWVDCYMSGMHGRNINNFCSRGERRKE